MFLVQSRRWTAMHALLFVLGWCCTRAALTDPPSIRLPIDDGEDGVSGDVAPSSAGRTVRRVSHTTSLLACLQDAHADREYVSLLLLEGSTDLVDKAKYDEAVQCGKRVLEEEVVRGGHCSSRQQDCPSMGDEEAEEATTTKVVVSDDEELQLDTDAVRKVFETEFSLHFLRHVAPLDDDTFTNKLEKFEKALLTELIPEYHEGMADADIADERGGVGEWWDEVPREQVTASRLLDLGLDPTHLPTLVRIMRLFSLATVLSNQFNLPLNDVYRHRSREQRPSEFFHPRVRQERYGWVTTRAVGCVRADAEESLIRARMAMYTVARHYHGERDADKYYPVFYTRGYGFVQELLKRKVHTHVGSISGAMNMAIGALNEVYLRATDDPRLRRSDTSGAKRLAAQALWGDFGIDGTSENERFVRQYIHLMSAAVVVFLTGHSLFEMLFTAHIRELGGGLGNATRGGGVRAVQQHPHLHADLVNMIQHAIASKRLGPDGMDGILEDVAGRTPGGRGAREIPESVVANVWRFIRLGLVKHGGLELPADDSPSRKRPRDELEELLPGEAAEERSGEPSPRRGVFRLSVKGCADGGVHQFEEQGVFGIGQSTDGGEGPPSDCSQDAGGSGCGDGKMLTSDCSSGRKDVAVGGCSDCMVWLKDVPVGVVMRRSCMVVASAVVVAGFLQRTVGV